MFERRHRRTPWCAAMLVFLRPTARETALRAQNTLLRLQLSGSAHAMEARIYGTTGNWSFGMGGTPLIIPNGSLVTNSGNPAPYLLYYDYSPALYGYYSYSFAFGGGVTNSWNWYADSRQYGNHGPPPWNGSDSGTTSPVFASGTGSSTSPGAFSFYYGPAEPPYCPDCPKKVSAAAAGERASGTPASPVLPAVMI